MTYMFYYIQSFTHSLNHYTMGVLRMMAHLKYNKSLLIDITYKTGNNKNICLRAVNRSSNTVTQKPLRGTTLSCPRQRHCSEKYFNLCNWKILCVRKYMKLYKTYTEYMDRWFIFNKKPRNKHTKQVIKTLSPCGR